MASEKKHSAMASNIPAVSASADHHDWDLLLRGAKGKTEIKLSPSELYQIFAPLCSKHPQERYVVAHLAQSLDGKIATDCGVSRWLSGEEDLLHTHRMRAFFDAVLVGVNTILLDNPQLTVRRCSGPNPARVILDPMRRLDGSQQVFLDSTAKTLLLTNSAHKDVGTYLGHAPIIGVDMQGSVMNPKAILSVLADLGLHRIFIEGGGTTVSRFLQAGVLNRLQLTVAPVLLGSGRPALVLPQINDLKDGLRPITRQFKLGVDTMFECIFQ